MDKDIALIHYYSRKHWFHHAKTACDLGLTKRAGDPILLYWKAVSILMCQKPVEALRDLLPLLEKRDLVLACPAAMIYAHRHCKTVDQDSLEELQAKLTIASSATSLPDKAHAQVALFYLYIGDIDQAKKHAKAAVETPNSSPQSFITMGWIELHILTTGGSTRKPTSFSWFDRALDRENDPTDALLGKMEYLRKVTKQLDLALELAAQISVRSTDFLPAHIERMWILLGMEAWDQMLEAANRLLNLAPDNVDALIAVSLYQMCRDGNLNAVADQLGHLNQLLNRVEPSNTMLVVSICKTFARLATRHSGILQHCTSMIECALKAEATSEIWAELGYLRLLQGDTNGARNAHQTASNLDPHNFDALQGLIHCQLLEGDYLSAGEQLELCNELQLTIGTSSYIAYLSSLHAWLSSKNLEHRLRYLEQVSNMQLQIAGSSPPSMSYFSDVNIDLLLEVARDFMDMVPSEPPPTHPALQSAETLLSFVTRILPVCAAAVMLRATAQYLSQQYNSVTTILTTLLSHNRTEPAAHLLMARIHIHQKNCDKALNCCEMALAGGFEVRGWLSWNYLRGKAFAGLGRYEDAVLALSAALSAAQKSESTGASKVRRVSIEGYMPSDRVNVYLELVNCHGKLNHPDEATRLMQEAERLFASSIDGSRFSLARAELALQREDYDKALEILNGVPSSHPTYVDARTRMAEIYHKHRANEQSYTKCLADVVEHAPSADAFMRLGEAYMNVAEYEKAIAIYEQALQIYPTSTYLASNIGRALVKTHRYQKAIAYYEAALESVVDVALQLDLADLYRRLGQYEDAERVVREALEKQALHAEGVSKELILKQSVELNMSLARIFKASNNLPSTFTYLNRARDLQMRAISNSSSTASADENRLKCADICHQLGEVAQCMNDFDAAKDFWLQALQTNSAGRQSLICLIKLCMSQSDLGGANNHLNALLKLNSDDPEAAVLVADVSLRRGAFDQAIAHYKELLKRQPQNYMALERFIEVCRRAGLLAQAENVINLVEEARKKTIGLASIAGLRFCKGLYARYTNNTNAALKEFNACRRDITWGERATYILVEIFLNPDNEILGGDALSGVREAQEPGAELDEGDSDLLAVLTADKLLKELPQNPKSVRTRILECHALMATRHKAECDLAIARLTEILNEVPDHVPALLGLAIACMHLKQPPRARNQLKRVAKLDWTSEFGEEFEKSWLLLADLYIQGGKFDLATELVKKVLKHNQSSLRAYELLGHIMEKEASYRDASDQYERAWLLCNGNSTATGYRLAFNYLKAKRFVEAIDVCLKILEKDPEYPKIKKEILEKARAALRP
ncbi:hypothetical protein SeMB42_g06957 [Synchytrium endobioticum]|uniref:Tetratricopeptide repeat protein 21B n=1 Tax=Synchytrium endobioticum TaxID=286115 RepID=A0A507CH19_9FUNG|nr:hypothetical protein SeMB42_g06957 [Synchytrium endobioticum]TPX47974.1 hypothetical protein SeLEV6574_g02333 [Synchytrium endobioticum]